MYGPSSGILKTLTREPETYRTRDLRPGADAKTIWDDVLEGVARYYDYQKLGETDDQHVNYWYNKADILEDDILFPSDRQGKALYKANRPAVDRHADRQPDFARFIADESSSDEDAEWGRIEGHRALLTEAKDGDTQEDSWDDTSDTSSSSHEAEEKVLMPVPETLEPTPSSRTGLVPARKQGNNRKKKDSGGKGWDEAPAPKRESRNNFEVQSSTSNAEGTAFLKSKSKRNNNDDGEESESSDSSGDLIDLFPDKTLARMSAEDRSDLMAQKGWKNPYLSKFDRDPYSDFMTFMDREKSKRECMFE